MEARNMMYGSPGADVMRYSDNRREKQILQTKFDSWYQFIGLRNVQSSSIAFT